MTKQGGALTARPHLRPHRRSAQSDKTDLRLGDWQSLVERNCSACNALGKILSLDEFHYESLDVGGAFKRVNGRNVRVIQCEASTSASR